MLEVEPSEKSTGFPGDNEYTLTVSPARYNVVKFLIIALTIFVISMGITVVVLWPLYQSTNYKLDTDNIEICYNDPICFQEAGWRKLVMKNETEPCENFYMYACGNWNRTRSSSLNQGQNSRSIRDVMYDNNKNKILNLLGSGVSSYSYEQKVQAYFASCTDTYGREKLKGKPLLTYMKSSHVGPWYVLDPTMAGYDVTQAIISANKLFEVDALFSIKVIPDEKKTDESGKSFTRIGDIEVMHGGLETFGVMRYWYYYSTASKNYQKTKNAYKNMVREIGGYLARDSGLNTDDGAVKGRINQFVDDVIALETQLANIYRDSKRSSDQDDLEQKMRVTDLKTTYPFMDWGLLLRSLFNAADTEPLVSDSTQVIVHETTYFANLTRYITSMDQTQAQRMINNYIAWRVAYIMQIDLSEDYKHAWNVFLADNPRYKYTPPIQLDVFCMWKSRNVFANALGGMFVRNHFGEDAKATIDAITLAIKIALKSAVDSDSSFLAGTSKTVAKKKIDAISDKVAHSDLLDPNNPEKLNDYYADFDKPSTSDTFFENELKRIRFEWSLKKNLLKFGQDEDHWDPRYIKAYSSFLYYNTFWNEILVPAGLLQFPIFDKNFPAYSNYGAIGARIAHNIIHAIDSRGAFYDDQKQRKRWWTSDTIKNFRTKFTCFRNMIKKQTMSVQSGGLTASWQMQASWGALRELMAETSGLQYSYKAYNTTKSTMPNNLLPGFPTDRDKLFFLSYAQQYCFVRTPSATQTYNRYQRRIPDDYKVNFALSQFDKFKSTFKCKDTSYISKLGSENKCQLL